MCLNVCAWARVCVHMPWTASEVRGRHHADVTSLLLPWNSQELSSGCQAWQQALLSARPSIFLILFAFSDNGHPVVSWADLLLEFRNDFLLAISDTEQFLYT